VYLTVNSGHMPPAAKIRIDLNSPVPAYADWWTPSACCWWMELSLRAAICLRWRRLAMELGITSTVGEAYRTLAEEVGSIYVTAAAPR